MVYLRVYIVVVILDHYISSLMFGGVAGYPVRESILQSLCAYHMPQLLPDKEV